MAETLSSSKRIYSREFLLAYSGIQKQEPEIILKLNPFVVTEKKPKKPSRVTPGNPEDDNSYSKFLSRTPNPKKTQPLQFFAPPQTEVKKNIRPANYQPLPVAANEFHQKENLPSSANRNVFQSPVKLGFGPIAYKPIISPPTSPRPTTPNPKSALSPNYVRTTNLLPPNSPPRLLSSPSTPLSKITHLETLDSSLSPNRSLLKSPKSPRPISPLDDQRLSQRQKQIDYGYRTVGYVRYRLLVPREQRKPEYPRTPKKNQGCSKRSWDGQLKKWRRDLHLWDPESIETFRSVLDSDLVQNIIKSNPELEEIVKIVRDKIDNPSVDQDPDPDDSEYPAGTTDEPSPTEAPYPINSEITPIITLDNLVNGITGIELSGSKTPPNVMKTATLNVNSSISMKSIEKKVSPSRINDPKMHKVARTLIF